MQTKITLRMEKELIDRAKRHSAKSGKSVSKMVAEYFALLGSQQVDDQEMSPWMRRLYGSMRGAKVGERDYKRYLEEKYK